MHSTAPQRSSSAVQNVLERNSCLELELLKLQADKDHDDEAQLRRLRKMQAELDRVRGDLLRADERYGRLERDLERDREHKGRQGWAGKKRRQQSSTGSSTPVPGETISAEVGFPVISQSSQPDTSSGYDTSADNTTTLPSDGEEEVVPMEMTQRARRVRSPRASPKSPVHITHARSRRRPVSPRIRSPGSSQHQREPARRTFAARIPEGQLQSSEWEDEDQEQSFGGDETTHAFENNRRRPKLDDNPGSDTETEAEYFASYNDRTSERKHRRRDYSHRQGHDGDHSFHGHLDRHTLASELGEDASGTISRRSSTFVPSRSSSCAAFMWSSRASADDQEVEGGVQLPALPAHLSAEQITAEIHASDLTSLVVERTDHLMDGNDDVRGDSANIATGDEFHSVIVSGVQPPQTDIRAPREGFELPACNHVCRRCGHVEEEDIELDFESRPEDHVAKHRSGGKLPPSPPRSKSSAFPPLRCCFPFRHLYSMVTCTLNFVRRPAWRGVQYTAVVVLVVTGLSLGKRRREVVKMALGKRK